MLGNECSKKLRHAGIEPTLPNLPASDTSAFTIRLSTSPFSLPPFRQQWSIKLYYTRADRINVKDMIEKIHSNSACCQIESIQSCSHIVRPWSGALCTHLAPAFLVADKIFVFQMDNHWVPSRKVICQTSSVRRNDLGWRWDRHSWGVDRSVWDREVTSHRSVFVSRQLVLRLTAQAHVFLCIQSVVGRARRLCLLPRKLWRGSTPLRT